MGIEEWGVEGVEFRVRGSVGDVFRVRGSVGNRLSVGVSIRNRFREKYCPLLKTSGQLFTSHSPLLGEKPSIIESSPFFLNFFYLNSFFLSEFNSITGRR